jgi:5-methylcytosine-specific restriction enzyme subunit McrC
MLGNLVTVGSEPAPSPVNILTHLLLPEINALLLHGLATEFVTTTQTIRGIKGKLITSETFRQNHLVSGQTICAVEEQSPDILPNQIIREALTCLQKTSELAPDLAIQIKRILPAFAPVSGRLPNPMPTIYPPRHQNQRYLFILTGCTFILQHLMPVPEGKEYIFPEFLTDQKSMGSIFENFIRNFYRREQKQFRVKSEKLNWQGQGSTPEAQQHLPAMFTDISLQSAARKIIIDTKFYRKALQPHFQKEKLISKHLYQLFTYLHHSHRTKPEQTLEGMLLYPVVNQELNLEYTLSGYKVRICTINLNQPWLEIKSDLLRLVA